MEGICGRMCDACTWKEQLDCPGCQDGPGRRFSGGCPIADCCREKGHTACVTCTFSTGCALRRRDMPQNRLWAVEAERERRARLDRNAPVLAKWLWLLFWLVTPSVFSNILTMDTVAGAFPTAGVVGNVLAFLISLAYGVLLWQLREAAGRYRTAALCYLAGGIISGVLLLPAIPEGTGCGGCSPCRSWCWSSVPHIRSFMPMQRFWRSLTRSWRGSGGCFGNGGSACCWGCLDASSWH
mgnify:CR=1 FL=1